MAFDPTLEADEQVLSDLQVSFGKKGEGLLRLVLTNKRAFWPGRKLVAVSDPITTEFVRVEDVQQVSWRPPSLLARLGVAVVLGVVGLAWSFGTFFADGSITVGMPTAMLLVAPVFPFLARGKRVLTIRGNDKSFKWKSPITFGKTSRANLEQVESALVAWASATGVRLERDQ